MAYNAEPIVYIVKSKCTGIPENTYMPVHVAEKLINAAERAYDIDYELTMNIAGKTICRQGTMQTGTSLVECVTSQEENAAFISPYLNMHMKIGEIYGQALQSYEMAVADIDDGRYFKDANYRNKANENKKWVVDVLKECDATRKLLNKAKTYEDIQKIAEHTNSKTDNKMNKAR